MFTIVWDPVRAIDEALKQDGESQTGLAKRLEWDPSKISKILNRDQELRVWELIQIMEAQGRSYGYYFTPPSVRFGGVREKSDLRILGLATHRPLLRVA